MKICTAFILFLYSSLLAAQDISGFWKGTLSMPGGCFPTNNMELQITVDGDSAHGNSYHYEDIDNYVKKKFVGFTANEKIILQETYIILHIKYRSSVKCASKDMNWCIARTEVRKL